MTGDVFDIPSHLIPDGVAFQWFGLEQDRGITWRPVPFDHVSGHFGQFARRDDGAVVVMGMILMQRPKVLSDAYIKKCEDDARQLEIDQIEEMRRIVQEAGYTHFDIQVKTSPR